MRRLARSVAAGAVLVVVGSGIAPASADPTDQYFDGQFSWKVERESSATVPAEHYDYPMDLRGVPAQHGIIRVEGHSDDVELEGTYAGDVDWYLRLSAPPDRPFAPGQTYDATSEAQPGDDTPGLQLGSSSIGGQPCGWTDADRYHVVPYGGRFTVTEVEYTPGHDIRRFAVTFEVNCRDTAHPSYRGSIAVNSATAPSPIPDPTQAPAPVTAAQVTYDWLNEDELDTSLTWANPTNAAWSETVVDRAFNPWEPISTVVGSHTVYRGRGASLAVHEDLRTGGANSPHEFRIVPMNSAGRLGPATYLLTKKTIANPQADHRSVAIGAQVVIRGRLQEGTKYDATVAPQQWPGAVLPHQPLTLWTRPYNSPRSPWAFVRRTVTERDGAFTFELHPTANVEYQVRYPGAPGHLPMGISNRILLVAPLVDLAAQQRKVHRHAAITFTTARTTAGSRSMVQLQCYRNHRWTTVSTKRIRSAARTGSRVVIHYRADRRGMLAFRLVKPGDARHVNGVSRTVRVKVR